MSSIDNSIANSPSEVNPTDHQLAILFAGLDAVHPAVAAALRASFAQQVATLDADSADYNALVADLINVLRGEFVSIMHADPRMAVPVQTLGGK